MNTTLNKFFYIPSQGKLHPMDTEEESIKSLTNGGFIWLNYNKPTRDDLTKLIEPLGLHPLAIEDCLDEEQIPKIEDYRTNTFLLFNLFSYQNQKIITSEVDLFLGKNYLIVVTHNKSQNISATLTDIVFSDLEEATKGVDFLAHRIIDFIVDQKLHSIDFIEEELNNIEENIIKAPAKFKADKLIKLRRSLLTMRKSIVHERENLIKLCRRDSPFISETAIYHFRDIYDHITKFHESTEILREMISNLMEMYLSMMNNEMTMIANRTNQSVRRLTLITTIFMPLTLLTGIFGMSEWTMITGVSNWKLTYPLFFILMIIVGFLNYIFLKKFEGIEKKKDK